MKLTREERETLYRKSEADNDWDAWTLTKRVAEKWRKKGYEVKEDHQGGWSTRVRAVTVARRLKRSGPVPTSKSKAISEKPYGDMSASEIVGPI